jgi:hypothetical protein
MTYDRGAHFCCYADPRALPGVHRLAGALEDALAELEAASAPPTGRPARTRRRRTPRGDLQLVEQHA